MKKLLIAPVVFFAFSCSSTVVNLHKSPKDGPTITILPFENNTETPLAGLRVASITEGVASSKGYNLKRVAFTYQQKEYSAEEINRLIRDLQDKGVDYAITGSVNEFRYKAGIDGEPAVSITLKVYSVKDNRIVYTATASKSGWYYQSVSTLTQKLINKILPDVFPR
ncbi:MAG: hypothetical protein RMK75_03605 [Aquificaceae bacterium]|nr:hypothetical protein [Aquificaceae bacterium]MDW8423391.1 hypothetical protein [Aquificaceae bacterium]